MTAAPRRRAGNYLGAVRLYLAGCEAGERTELRHICRHANALLHVALKPLVRYIVVSPLEFQVTSGSGMLTPAQRGNCRRAAAHNASGQPSDTWMHSTPFQVLPKWEAEWRLQSKALMACRIHAQSAAADGAASHPEYNTSHV